MYMLEYTKKEVESLKESGEMYLESIYVLSKSKAKIHSVDIAEHMNYSKPSVSRAIGLLKNEGYITIGEDMAIELTEKGKKTAKQIFQRHTILTKMFISLGVDEKTATEDACKVEHVISQKTFDVIKKHFKQFS